MRVRVTGGVSDLRRDLESIPVKAVRGFAVAVRDTAREGNRLAKGFARESAGAHGKHYHKAFSTEPISLLSWEYGPDAAKPQGGMSFERGSRNQPPHLDLARSADIIGPKLADKAGDVMDRLFW
jgi:hypothetical protein